MKKATEKAAMRQAIRDMRTSQKTVFNPHAQQLTEQLKEEVKNGVLIDHNGDEIRF